MTATLFSIVLPGIIIVSILAYAVLPRWIVVTGPDKLTYKDVPKLNRYINIVAWTQLVLMFVTVVLELPRPQMELIFFALIAAAGIAAAGIAFALLEKKYLPGTRRYLVTLCWVAGICIVFAIYGWVAYF